MASCSIADASSSVKGYTRDRWEVVDGFLWRVGRVHARVRLLMLAQARLPALPTPAMYASMQAWQAGHHGPAAR